jgi:predicted NAD/FAD-binding protein
MQTLAIIGTGIAGMGCGHLLQKKYELSFFEKNDYVGGHTNTISVNENGSTVHMDTGFMVFNFETYPHLCRLFKEINAPIQKTEMSFSVQHRPSGLEYCGTGLNGLFAQRKNMFSRRYIRMLMQIASFNRISVQILDDPRYENYSLGQYIKEFRFGEDMLWKYLVPMSSAVWSTPMDKMLDFPAVTLIRFFKNHGFLGLNSQHQWYTLHNGSQSYRELLIRPFREKISVGKAAVKVSRHNEKATVHFNDGSSQSFDKVILACHADQALSLLEQPTPEEKRLLGPFKYQPNTAVVHIDELVMPNNKKTWSSWNYRIESLNGQLFPTTIYWMNRLQQVSERINYFVSINPIPGSIDKNKVIRQIDYEHPLFDVPAIQAQKELAGLNGPGPLYYCGSYFRYGFHEDAYKSAVDLCNQLMNNV